MFKQIMYFVLNIIYSQREEKLTRAVTVMSMYFCSYKLNVPIIKHVKYVYIKCHINII